MKVLKTMKTDTEIIKFYNNPLLGGEKITMGGRTYYMMKTKLDFENKEINRLEDNVHVLYKNINSVKCNNCQESKPVKHFYRDNSNSRGYHNRCKQCCQSIREQELKLVG